MIFSFVGLTSYIAAFYAVDGKFDWPIYHRFADVRNSSGGRVIRASASGAVDLVLIPSRVKPLTLKLVFTASLLDAQH